MLKIKECVCLSYSNIRIFRLALKNFGKSFEENISVKLYFDSESIFSVENFETHFQKILLNDFDNIFNIERSANFFDYYSANEKIIVPTFNFPVCNRNLSEEWKNIFPYRVHKFSDTIVIELNFDEISPQAVIAFPTVLLLTKTVQKIKFEILSKSAYHSGYLYFNKKKL